MGVELTWSEDERGWSGTDAGVHRARLVAQSDERWPWSATSWRGWVVDCPSLERAKELMDRHASDPLPPAEKPRARRQRLVANGDERPPHPGTLRRPPK